MGGGRFLNNGDGPREGVKDPVSTHDVFVSYSSKDRVAADAVCAALERHGWRCWMAPRDITPGGSYPEQIVNAITTARGMVVVFSENANTSRHVAREIERADNRGHWLIPVRIEEVAPRGPLEYFLSSAHWLDAHTPPRDADLEQLAAAVRRYLPAPTRTAGTTPADTPSPSNPSPDTAPPAGPRPRRGNDLETETELSFREAVNGVAMPLRLTAPAPCPTCSGTGARPGTEPRTCPRCRGDGSDTGPILLRTRPHHRRESCAACGGTGSVLDDPCRYCEGTGVTTQTRTVNVRIPAGITHGQRVRVPGQGEPGPAGAPAGDLYIDVNVAPDRVFGRTGDDLTATVPITVDELANGTTLSIPTLDGVMGVVVPAGTANGRVLRVAGRGVPKKDGSRGDLLITVRVGAPPIPQ